MRRLRDILVLLAVSAVTAVAAIGHFTLPIDIENAAMKSVDTPQAVVSERAALEFGADHTLFLLLEPRGGARGQDRYEADARCWLQRLLSHPRVASGGAVPVGGAGSTLARIDVRAGPDGRYADSVRAVVAEARRTAPPTHRLYVSGQPVGEIAISEALVAEQSRVVPAIAVALLVLLLACYRRASLALGALLPAFAGILVVGGLQKLAGLAVDPVSALLAPVLLTVGVAGSVHLVERFLARRDRGDDVERAARLAVRELLVPAGLTVVTTVAGFLGLLASPIPAVRRFGMLAAIGVGITCLTAFVTVPPWLRLFARSKGIVAVATSRGPWAFLGAGLATTLRARARAVVLTVGAGAAVFAWAWSGLHVDTDPIRILPADHPFRVATARMGEVVGGVDSFDLLLEAPQPPYASARLALLEAQLTMMPGVVAPLGPARIGQTGSRMISLLLRPGGTSEREQTFRDAECAARDAGFQNASATGPAVLVARDSGALVRGQAVGLLFTLGFLWVAMTVGFRSIRLGTLGLVPNVLPCVLLYGSLGFADRALSVGTSMIGSVMLGVVVDDTIHFLHGYRSSRVAGSGVTVSLARAFRRSGRAIIVTSLVLSFGFSAGLLGELETTREFGLVASCTILVALVADLIVLPAVVLIRSPSPSRSLA